jgi:predicted AAA+ superfamily ATPase
MRIDRKVYLDKLIGHMNNKLINIVTGARRVGKSLFTF